MRITKDTFYKEVRNKIECLYFEKLYEKKVLVETEKEAVDIVEKDSNWEWNLRCMNVEIPMI